MQCECAIILVERLLHCNAPPSIVFTLEWPRFHVSNLHAMLHMTFVSNKLYPQLNFTTVSTLKLAILIQSTDTINSSKFTPVRSHWYITCLVKILAVNRKIFFAVYFCVLSAWFPCISHFNILTCYIFFSIMVYSHCTGTGPGQVQATGPRAMSPNILYRNVHTGPKQGKEPGHIVSYCAGPCPYICLSPVLVQCE